MWKERRIVALCAHLFDHPARSPLSLLVQRVESVQTRVPTKEIGNIGSHQKPDLDFGSRVVKSPYQCCAQYGIAQKTSLYQEEAWHESKIRDRQRQLS